MLFYLTYNQAALPVSMSYTEAIHCLSHTPPTSEYIMPSSVLGLHSVPMSYTETPQRPTLPSQTMLQYCLTVLLLMEHLSILAAWQTTDLCELGLVQILEACHFLLPGDIYKLTNWHFDFVRNRQLQLNWRVNLNQFKHYERERIIKPSLPSRV